MTIRAAGVLFITPGRKVLFLKRGAGGDWPGAWCFPGGKAEAGEKALDAAKRETREEIGDKAPLDDPKLWTRRIAIDLVTTPGIVPPAPTQSVETVANAVVSAQPEEVDFSTFVQTVAGEFPVTVDGEHIGWAWAPIDQPPEPLHPGCRVALSRFGMDELGIARGVMAGDLTSPQRYGNVTLWDLRITGTGAAFRDEKTDDKGKIIREAEYVYRRPENYLAPDYLARCNGLPVIMMHPNKAVLDSKEFAARIVGTMMLPYLGDGLRHPADEVWGIAKVFDDDANKILETMPMSTSPGVVLGNGDRTIRLEDGQKFLIEGKPSLMDHLAICERGVWDKGGDPAGVVSQTIEGTDMTDEEKARKDAEEQARKDAESKTGEKLDKLLTGIDSLTKRMDAIEDRHAKDDKARKDAEEKAEAERTDTKRRADAEKEEKEFADACARGDAKKKGPLEGFESGGVFHPIRSSAGYSKRKANDSDGDYRSRHDAEEGEERKSLEEAGMPKTTAADRAKKHRKDAEEAEENERKADAARHDSVDPKVLAELAGKVEALAALSAGADREAFAAEQARADSVYSAHGGRAPAPMLGESLAAYRVRLANGMKAHSGAWKDVDLLKIVDPAAFAIAQGQIYADAEVAARNPVGVPGGLRMVEKKGPSGHTIREFHGDPASWMGRFSGARTMVRSVNISSTQGR